MESPPSASNSARDLAAFASLDGWTELLTELSSGDDPRLDVRYDDALALSDGQPTAVVVVVDIESDAAANGAPPATAAWISAPTSVAVRSAMAPVEAMGGAIDRTFDHLPVAVVQVDSLPLLETLASQSRTRKVKSISSFELALSEALPLVHQPVGLASGWTGEGVSVAVLDTGIDYHRAEFGACAQPGEPGCAVRVSVDVAADDGVADDASLHGSQVAAAVLAVAPEAGLVAVDVVGASGEARLVDVLAAIDWVIEHRDEYGIVAVNFSLSAGRYLTPCLLDPVATALSVARAHGIVPVASSGNRAYKNAVATPACGPDVVSVGAVYDSSVGSITWPFCKDHVTQTDLVACFSNSYEGLTLLAPGAFVANGELALGGTSMAAAFVSGAIAGIRSANPTLAADDIVEELIQTGALVTDPANGVTTPRLELHPEELGCVQSIDPSELTVGPEGGSFTLQAVAPADCAWAALETADWLTVTAGQVSQGSAAIHLDVAANAGGERSVTLRAGGKVVPIAQQHNEFAPRLWLDDGAPYTNSRTVALRIELAAGQQFKTFCVKNAPVCDSWSALQQTEFLWKLPKGEGTKHVFLWLRTAELEVVGPVSASIVVDSYAPYGGEFLAVPGVGQVALSWPGFTDDVSGVGGYQLAWSPSHFPTTCKADNVIYEGEDTEFVHMNLDVGVDQFYTLCASDAAGNVNKNIKVKALAIPEADPPEGFITALGPTATTKSTALIALEYSDESGVDSMCVGVNGSCATWLPYASQHKVALVGGQGAKTVSVVVRDTYGTQSAPQTIDYVYDASLPTDGNVTVTRADESVRLDMTGFSDAFTDVVGYIVGVSTGTHAPWSCSVDSPSTVYAGPEPTFTHSSLQNGVRYRYRVCAVDAAGNVSKGSYAEGVPAPELNGPSGSVAVVGSPAYVNALSVYLTFDTDDESAVTEVCLSNAPSCDDWRPLDDPIGWWLDYQGLSTKTVYAWFRDEWTNASTEPATYTVTLDTTAPAGGTLTAEPVASETGPVVAELQWGGFSDAVSGVDRYRMVWHKSIYPPSTCSVGGFGYEGPATSFTYLPSGPGTYSFRVCAIDQAGNMSAGVTAVAVLP